MKGNAKGVLRGSTALAALYLGDNGIGDAGAAALAGALQGNSSLRTLFLGVNDVRAAGADALAGALKTMANRSLNETQ